MQNDVMVSIAKLFVIVFQVITGFLFSTDSQVRTQARTHAHMQSYLQHINLINILYSNLFVCIRAVLWSFLGHFTCVSHRLIRINDFNFLLATRFGNRLVQPYLPTIVGRNISTTMICLVLTVHIVIKNCKHWHRTNPWCRKSPECLALIGNSPWTIKQETS